MADARKGRIRFNGMNGTGTAFCILSAGSGEGMTEGAMPRPETENRKTLLSQGIDLVRFLAHSRHALGVTEIAEKMELPKSSAFRLLGVLMELRFVQKNPATQRYTISPEIFRFVYEVAHEFAPNRKLEDVMIRWAQKLDCAVYLSMLSERCTYVVSAEGPLGGTFALGSAGPVYASSAGKVIVANLPEEEWVFYEPTEKDERLTSYTNLDPARFRKELLAARESGVAWNMRETTPEVASVAALVREPLYPPRMAVALLVSYEEVAVHDRVSLERHVRELAAELSKGFRPGA